MCNKINAFNIWPDITECHSLPQGQVPLNFLERQVKFHNTNEGFRHNKRGGGREGREGGGEGGVRSPEEGSGEGQGERCRRQSHTVLTTT